jgi:hypothetical protein
MVYAFTLLHSRQALVTGYARLRRVLELAPSRVMTPGLRKSILGYLPTPPDSGGCGWWRGRNAKSSLIT